MSCCFISDVHLSSTNDNTIFINWLESLSPDIKSLYILGDLFDAWSNTELKAPWCQEVIQALSKASKKRKIFCMLGNHDFLLDEEFARLSEVELIKADVFSLKYNDKNILITHGDILVKNDFSYLIFRTIVRSKLSRFLYGSLNEKNKLKLIDSIKKESNEKPNKSVVSLSQKKIQKIMSDYFKTIDFFICGHFHKKQIFTIEGASNSTKVVVLNSWGSQIESDGRFFLLE